jgi:hypothetical protein
MEIYLWPTGDASENLYSTSKYQIDRIGQEEAQPAGDQMIKQFAVPEAWSVPGQRCPWIGSGRCNSSGRLWNSRDLERGKGAAAVDISFVTVDAFAPDADPWVPVGAISAVSEESGDFLLRLGDETLAIRLSILSATCLRVRFSPRADADYETETSLAVIDRDIGPVDVRVAENTSQRRCAAGAERTGQGAGRDRRMRGPTRSAPAGPASQGQCAQEDRTTRIAWIFHRPPRHDPAGRQRNIDICVDRLHDLFAADQLRQPSRIEAAFGEQARALIM